MVANMSISTFDMIVLLTEAQENGYASQWGFSSLLDYGAKELGLKKRKTQYLSRIGYVMRAVGLARAQYEPAGVTKLRGISTLDPEGSFFNKEKYVNEPLSEHIVRLVLDSDEMNAEQVEDEVLRLQDRLGPNRPVHRTTVYPRSVWDLIIKPAREMARSLLGSARRDKEGNAEEYSDAACDEMIFARFLTDPNNVADPEGEKKLDNYEGSELPVIKIPMEDIKI